MLPLTRALILFLVSFYSNPQVRIWEVGRRDLAAQIALTYIDENIAVLLYKFPETAKANEEAIIEVGIARIGDLPEVEGMYADSGPNTSISIVSTSKTSLTTVLAVRLRKRDNMQGHANVTLAACAQPDACPKKKVQFLFYFRDPDAPWVNDISPRSMFIDGRLPVSLDIENLPAGLTTQDFIVTFVENATIVSVKYKDTELANGKFQLVLTVAAPGVLEPAVIQPILRIPREQLAIQLDVFTYSIAPQPTFQDGGIKPARAKTNAASPVQVILDNFPGVLVKTEIEVRFRWPSGELMPAQVSEFSRVDSSKHPLAIQSIQVLLFTPIGSEVKEGAVQLQANHGQFRGRVAKTGYIFTFIDATSPEIVGAVSTGVDSGTDSVKVQMSKPTQVSLYVGNAKSEVAQVFVGTGALSSGNIQYPLKGPTLLDMETNSFDASSKMAKISFSMPGATQSGYALGVVHFGAECGGDVCASAACCESATCIDLCKDRKGDSCKMACFKLQFFDDLQPRILFISSAEGPEIGGSILKLTVAMLPLVEPGAPVGAVFDGRADLMGTVYVRSSTLEETSLDLV
jgi:hypothetical protein